MSSLGKTFDANQYEPRDATSFDPLPAGWYAATIVESETKETANKDGSFLALTFELIEAHHPQLKGRRVWTNLNLWNKSQQAVDIANRELSTICRHVGQMQVSDSEQLHNKPLAIKVKVRPPKGEFEAGNSITGYDSIAGRFGHGPAPTGPQHATGPGVQHPPAPTAPAGKPPWAKT